MASAQRSLKWKERNKHAGSERLDRFDKVVWAVILLSGLVSLLLGMATGILIVKLVGGCLVLLSFFTGLGEMKVGIDLPEKDQRRDA